MRGFLILALCSTACSVELAPPVKDGDGGTSGAASHKNGGTGSGGTTGPGGAGGFGAASGGVGGSAGAGAGGGGGVDPCTLCLDQKSCPTCSTPECVVMAGCLDACTTPDCQIGCYGANNNAYIQYFASWSCVYQACPTECIYGVECFNCENMNCNSQKLGCVQSDSCLGYWYCLDLCAPPDENCYNQCDSYWADGISLYDSYASCSYQSCNLVCI